MVREKIEELHRAAIIASCAYSPRRLKDLANWSRRQKDLVIVRRGGCVAAILAGPKRIDIGFAGTNGPLDVVHDLMMGFRMRPQWPNWPEEADIAAGIIAQLEWWRGVLPQLLRATEKAVKQYPDARLTVSGHSLGGVLAQAYAHRLCLGEIVRPDLVVAVSSPRYGNEFAVMDYEAFGMETVNILPLGEHGETDLVTRLPLSAAGNERPGSFLVLRDEDGEIVLGGREMWEAARRSSPTPRWKIVTRFRERKNVHGVDRALGMLGEYTRQQRKRRHSEIKPPLITPSA